MNDNKIDEFIRSYPRETLQVLVIAFFIAWQSVPAIIGILLYVILKKCCELPWWLTLPMGLVVSMAAVLLQTYCQHISLR
jgi:hypothetical protein